jgi:hypothetical protein
VPEPQQASINHLDAGRRRHHRSAVTRTPCSSGVNRADLKPRSPVPATALGCAVAATLRPTPAMPDEERPTSCRARCASASSVKGGIGR